MMANERGMGTIGVLVWVLLLAVVNYHGITIAGIYLDYGRMDDYVAVQANFAQMNKDEDILNNLLTKAKDLDLPLKEKTDFSLVRTENKITISTQWTVEVHLFKNPDLPSYPFEFKVKAEQAIPGK